MCRAHLQCIAACHVMAVALGYRAEGALGHMKGGSSTFRSPQSPR